MENRGEISYREITQCIENVKFDISKGPQNPAHAWIQRLRFSKSDEYFSDYYEGKKATPSDIANNLPVVRPIIENEIIDSIEKNTITIIKTSSGQGKTTLALRAISLLNDEYTPYQIIRCNNNAELGHIVEYFRMRTRIGEKPLILLDNLDAHLSEWNLLAQLMQTGVTYHYKLLITSRENDWYNYGGDISNLHHLQIIKPILNEKEAENIYSVLKKEGKLHGDITDWKNAWSKIAGRQLLIEYKAMFDDAYEHGGLILVATELCPFAAFKDYEYELNTLEKMSEMMPDNTNIQHMIKLRDSIPNFRTSKTDIYCLSSALYLKLKEIDFTHIEDVESYAVIVDWLYNIDHSMNLSSKINLNDLWDKVENYSIKAVSSLMYSTFCGNEEEYNEFVKVNFMRILDYLKCKTNSHKIQVSDDNKKIKVEYLLRTSDIKKSNNESVSRLTDICRTLPIFETYCADAIKPQIDLLESYQIPNDAHKEMPKRNIIITFHQEFNGLWLRTIESNYEFDTVYAWIEHWLDVRKCACDLLAAISACLHKLLGNRKLGNAASIFDTLHNRYNNMMVSFSISY